MVVDPVICTVYNGNYQSPLDERMKIRGEKSNYLPSIFCLLDIVIGMYYVLRVVLFKFHNVSVR